jgi:hypothetical protein
MQIHRGGFEVRPADKNLVNTQKAITKKINELFVRVGAVYLKPASKFPIDDEWYKRLSGDTDLQTWIDSEEESILNVGFNLQMGWLDIDIDAEDPEYNKDILAAMKFLGIDTRFAFGRLSVNSPTHLMVQLSEDDTENLEMLKKFEPRKFLLGGKHYHVQLRSNGPDDGSSKQVVMPGSLYMRKTPGPTEYDPSVWYGGTGSVASTVVEIAQTTPRRATFTDIVRAVSFGTIAYIMRPHWVEGNRQNCATKFTGWLNRVVRDSIAINENEGLATEVFCPIDADSWAQKLIEFLCHSFGDEEQSMRLRTYFDARDKLQRNPDAKIPGWRTMDEMVGGEALAAMRLVLTPGSDISILTQLAERYVYDETDNRYIDRTRHEVLDAFAHEGAELERRHKGDVIMIAGRPREAFKVFESSTLRTRVSLREMYPSLTPGRIYRIDANEKPVPDEEERTAVTVFNTWRGWPIPPLDFDDPELLAECERYLNQLLMYLTSDNKKQVEWVKDWIAWTFQHPGDKQQIAWVCIGGQGVGKSFFGNVFMQALMRRTWGTSSAALVDGKFSVEPFIDKMFVFIDEAKFSNEAGVDEIKKLIRNVSIAGQEKFGKGRTYRIFSRIMFASNKLDINVGQRDVQDRALFYTRAYDKEFMKMSSNDFNRWTITLKPFFDDFQKFLNNDKAVRQFVRMFMTRDVNRYAIESVEYSSGNDPAVVMANMTWTRRVAKHIIESGWVMEGVDIEYPFRTEAFFPRVYQVARDLGFKSVQPDRVLADLRDTGVLEDFTDTTGNFLRFKYKFGTLLEEYARATNVRMSPTVNPTADDFGDNDVHSGSRKTSRLKSSYHKF